MFYICIFRKKCHFKWFLYVANTYCFCEQIKNFVLWFVLTAPILQLLEPCCAVKGCSCDHHPARSPETTKQWCESLTCNVTSSGVDVDSVSVTVLHTPVCLGLWEAASVFYFHPSKYNVSALIWDSLVAWGGDTENRMSIAEAGLSPFRPLNCCLSTQCALLSGPLATVLCLICVLCLLFQSVHKLCS